MDYLEARREEMKHMTAQLADLTAGIDFLFPSEIEYTGEHEGIEFQIVNIHNTRQRSVYVDGTEVTGIYKKGAFWIGDGRRDRHPVRAARYALTAFLNS